MIAIISDVHYPSDRLRCEGMKKGLEDLKKLRPDVLFVCGDFTDDRKDTPVGDFVRVPDCFENAGFTVAYIDGNHEDYDVLEGLPEAEFAGNVAKLACVSDDGIFYLKRGRCYSAGGFDILAIGGSTSGPGYKKRHPDIWQPQEDLSEHDRMVIDDSVMQSGNRFDIVLTHTLPTGRMKQWFPKKDVSVTNDILEETADRISFAHWFFGHFHKDADYPGNFHCLYNDVILLEKTTGGVIKCERRRFCYN